MEKVCREVGKRLTNPGTKDEWLKEGVGDGIGESVGEWVEEGLK